MGNSSGHRKEKSTGSTGAGRSSWWAGVRSGRHFQYCFDKGKALEIADGSTKDGEWERFSLSEEEEDSDVGEESDFDTRCDPAEIELTKNTRAKKHRDKDNRGPTLGMALMHPDYVRQERDVGSEAGPLRVWDDGEPEAVILDHRNKLKRFGGRCEHEGIACDMEKTDRFFLGFYPSRGFVDENAVAEMVDCGFPREFLPAPDIIESDPASASIAHGGSSNPLLLTDAGLGSSSSERFAQTSGEGVAGASWQHRIWKLRKSSSRNNIAPNSWWGRRPAMRSIFWVTSSASLISLNKMKWRRIL